MFFPENLPEEITKYMKKQKYMMVIYVDSSDCSICSMKHLTPLGTLQFEMERRGTGILLVIRNSNEKEILRTVRSIGNFHFIFDKNGAFRAANRVFKASNDNIIVMDREQKVIFAESPIKDKKSWDKFIEHIKRK